MALISTSQRRKKKPLTWTKSSRFINMQQGCWDVCVMDGRRWRLWQLINALIISGEDLPLLPELTEWAVCGLTSNPVFRARPLLSAVWGSHSFSFQKKSCTFFWCCLGVQQWWNSAPGCSGISATALSKTDNFVLCGHIEILECVLVCTLFNAKEFRSWRK